MTMNSLLKIKEKMVQHYLDPRVRKAILNMEDKVTDISNLLSDMNMKLCHMIKDKRDPYEIYRDMVEGNDHGK
jgi:hypothetical protein